MKLILKKVILEQFKGVSHAEYDFGERTNISGRNAAGKTTIADAVIWLFTDKDYSLKSNPEIHPDFLPVSEPSVTVISDIDGKEVTFRKFQKDSRTKKQVEAGVPIRISNQYEINSVPKSQKDFVAYMEECDINVETILLLSHPEIFTSQKSSDCRKILFDMVSNITDKDIADSLPDCAETSALLESYTVEEITAMKKREQKEANENMDAIPNQIIGLEKAKVELPLDEFNAQKEKLFSEIEQMQKSIEDMDIQSIGDLNQQLALLDQEERQLKAQANSDRIEKYNSYTTLICTMQQEERDKSNEMNRKKDELDYLIRCKKDLEERFESLKGLFDGLKASEFTVDNDGKCPNCNQPLPVHMLDKLKTQFEEHKVAEMKRINLEAKEVASTIKSCCEKIKLIQEDIGNLDASLNRLSKEIQSMQKEREPLEHVIDIAGSEALVSINMRRANIKHQMAKSDDMKSEVEEIRSNIRVRERTIREIDNKIAELRVNDRIDKQIEDLKQKQREYANAEAQASKIIDQLKDISMAKNKALTDEVNRHFNIVRFKLFEQQKNGDFKDCCIPMIKSSDGTYKVLGESANTALEVRGKLDIIAGLQKFYNQYLPVFLDGAECLDAENLAQIHMDTQLITLSVTDGDLKVEVV